MTGPFNTRLANLYFGLVQSGQIEPVDELLRFRYPSVRQVVPTFTTYGITDRLHPRPDPEEVGAQLESSTT